MHIASVRESITDIAVGITAYGPDSRHLPHLIAAVAPCVARVYVFVNSAIDPALRDALAALPDVEMIEARTNLGVGVALNLIALAAILAGYKRLCVFDQDSNVSPGLVGRLADAWDRLDQRGLRPAVIAPRLVETETGDVKSKRQVYVPARGTDRIGPLLPVQFAATSGSFLDLACLRGTGWFRADYFIDSIDIEWCYRAQFKGFSCWVASDLEMQHPVGRGVIQWPLVRLSMPRQAPFRMYCHFRNATYGLRLRHVPLAWKLKQICYLPLQALAYLVEHRGDVAVARLLIAGFADGLRAKLGFPRGLPNSTTPSFRGPP